MKVQNFGSGVWGLGFRAQVQVLRSRVADGATEPAAESGGGVDFRVLGLKFEGFGVRGSGLRVEGLGLRI